MSHSSMVYTVGTALNRAAESGSAVEVLVEGTWIAGHVVALDGHGIVLERRGREHAIVRLEKVTAMRIVDPAPASHAEHAASAGTDRTEHLPGGSLRELPA